MRLLLVEDDSMIGEAVLDLLRAEQYAVDWARDGDAADTALRTQAYDLVLLDLGLPQRDGLAVLRDLGLADDDARVNPNGGAIALGHPLGASGARLATTAVNQLHQGGGRYALCTMCIGVGQGIAVVLERV